MMNMILTYGWMVTSYDILGGGLTVRTLPGKNLHLVWPTVTVKFLIYWDTATFWPKQVQYGSKGPTDMAYTRRGHLFWSTRVQSCVIWSHRYVPWVKYFNYVQSLQAQILSNTSKNQTDLIFYQRSNMNNTSSSNNY